MKLSRRGFPKAGQHTNRWKGKTGAPGAGRIPARPAAFAPAHDPSPAPVKGLKPAARKPSVPLRKRRFYYGMPNVATPGSLAAAARERKPKWARALPAAVLACTAVLAAAGVFLALSLAEKPALARGLMMYFDGRPLGVVESRDVAEEAMQRVQDGLEDTYGMDVAYNEDVLSFAPVSCESSSILGEQDVEQAIRANLDAKAIASVILVNDRPAVALRSPEEAQKALDAVLLPFRSASGGRTRTDVSFVENVRIELFPVDFNLVQSVGDAVRTLSLGTKVQDNYYTVKKGDSLARIARAFKVKVSDLRKANPEMADVLQPGDSINVIKPVSWVNVRYSETVTRQEELPFQTVEKPDSTLYTTQKKTQQDGRTGRREVMAKVTYINGMEASKEILSQTVIEEAQDRIVLRGTKKVPANASGGSVSAGRFALPLNTYRITSRYGMRSLQGITRLHAGVDLAAPTGTPIYASRSGTVTFSGSASGYGLLVKISHDDGVETRYGHCSKLLVKKGQSVKKGQLIALVGSTGRSTGPHCHFEVRVNGKAVDPLK